MNRKAIDYSVLDRDVESNKQIYETLLQRAKETGVSGELSTSNIRVVDQAERPRGPVSPRKALNMLLGALRRLPAGVRPRVLLRVPRQPDQDAGRDRGRSSACRPSGCCRPSTGKRWPAASADQRRRPRRTSPRRSAALRTNVLFSTADEGARSIVVTSTGPGEGKTMVAGNLASALAQAGQRVLLIDADMRRPRCTSCSTWRRSRACRTCWSAPPRRARRCARPASPACG